MQSEKTNREKSEGFTRNMYVMVEDRNTQSISRLDYDWYSSNDDIAIVTSYGTVLAKNVDTNIEVKIYAMLKENPSIVYEKTFTIINDESVTPIEITSNMSYSYSELNGEYKLELNTNNSIFPYIQYYTWEIEENELNVNKRTQNASFYLLIQKLCEQVNSKRNCSHNYKNSEHTLPHEFKSTVKVGHIKVHSQFLLILVTAARDLKSYRLPKLMRSVLIH